MSLALMGERVRIVFVGTTAFGLRILKAVQPHVVGAVAAPQTFSISYRPGGVTNVRHADIPGHCAESGIPCALLETGMADLLPQIRAWKPDPFLVAGWFHMIPKAWREIAPAYGLHASLLPDYAGGAPLVWAMINGEKKTGITLFQLGDGVDDGPIVAQAETDILPDDTIATLYDRIEDLAVGLVGGDILSLPHIPQDFSKRRVFPQRGPEDGEIDWSWTAEQVHNFVRAQTKPYPGAFSKIDGKFVRIWDVKPFRGSYPVGKITRDDPYIMVGCGEGSVALERFDA